MEPSKQTLGALAKARNIRQAYLSNPNLCLQCHDPILPKEGKKLSTAKLKIFCSRRCAASYNNRMFPKRVAKQYLCRECNDPIDSGRQLCDLCYQRRLLKKRKDECLRAQIGEHARRVMSTFEQICYLCSYSTHVQTCHIRAVSDFPPDAPIAEINSRSNLVLLCPNHHWEFDHGLMDEALADQLR